MTIEKYDAIYDAVAELKNETVLLEPEKVNFALYKKIDASNRVVEAMNPTSLMKAVKNPVEMENLRKAHLKDGVALTKFLYWMKKNAGKVALTETEAAERLEDYRKAQEGYLGPSFTTISAFGSNAAMCHYHATKEQESPVGTDGFYLVDSGGQYYEGTTDVTRTIAIGHVTDEMKVHFTLDGNAASDACEILIWLPRTQCGLFGKRPALGARTRLQPWHRSRRRLPVCGS